jgi:hypothetical protein
MSEIFNEATDKEPQTPTEIAPVNNQPVTPVQAQVPDALKELVGEGKKYKTVDDAIASLPHAQNHISTLESELAELRSKVSGMKTAEELIAEMKRQETPKVDDNQPKGVSPEEISQLVERVLNQKSTEQTQLSNARKVVDTFKEAYGDKAVEMYNKIAQENGIPVHQLDMMAKTSPQVILKLANIQKPQAGQSGKIISDQSVNTQQPAFDPNSIKVGKHATTKDMTRAWRAAGEAIKQELNL